MENRSSDESYFQFSPAGSLFAPERYLAQLVNERHKLAPFLHIFPASTRLLDQEIMHVSKPVFDHQQQTRTWSPIGVKKLDPFQQSLLNRHFASNTPVVKRVLRLDIPVDKYPNYNFVGRILGPRGNSLKRFEAATQCRLFIRGKGSIKDPLKEEKLKDKAGYDHLTEPLHVLLEAEFSEDIVASRVEQAVAILEDLLKPMDESLDLYKQEQLRELAEINGTFMQESPSISPFSGLKRPKTGS